MRGDALKTPLTCSVAKNLALTESLGFVQNADIRILAGINENHNFYITFIQKNDVFKLFLVKSSDIFPQKSKYIYFFIYIFLIHVLLCSWSRQ